MLNQRPGRKRAPSLDSTDASDLCLQIWAERVGTSTKVACLGAKSEATCRAMGFDDLFVGGGGIEGWAKAVELALGSVQEK